MRNPSETAESEVANAPCQTQDAVTHTALSCEEQQLILQLQQDILESVARGGETKDVIKRICLLAEQLLPNSVGTVMLLDQACEFLNVYAAPSIPPEGISRLHQLRPGPGSGSCGNAVFRNEPQFVQNTFTDSRWRNLRNLAYDFNLCSCWSMPILAPDDKAIGSFALSSFEHRSPSSFHRKILEIGASIVGIVLERSKSQEALRDSEEKYERLIEEVGENFVIFSHAFSGELLYVSAGMEKVFGIQAKDALGKTWETIIQWVPGNIEKAQRLLHGLAESANHFLQHEMQFMHPDGRVHIIQVSVHAVRDALGQAVRFEGIAEDITRRKASETRIAQDYEQQKILRELLEISLAPQSLESLLQQCLDMLMRISWLSILPRGSVFLMEEGNALNMVASHDLSPEMQSRCARVAIGQCFCGQTAASGQIQYTQCIDERHIKCYEGMVDHGLYNVPLKFGDKVLGVLAVYLPLDYQRDLQSEQFITSASDILAGLISRKQAETALFAHKAHLEKLVDERTAELRSAKNAAEAASLAKTSFLANMSHELRTPLQTIIGAEHMMRIEPLSQQQTQWLDRQSMAGNHLLDVINDILDLSKIEADKVVLEDAEVEVLDILQDVAQLIESRAHDKDLKVRLDAHSVPQKLYGDAGRLRQALLNYAGNAVKFSDKGDILLRSMLMAEDAHSATLRFEVIDSGIGIDQGVVDRLFSAFEQADNGLTRQYGGSGLGLAITKQLARLMGGDAGVQSVKGKGSTFWFTARLRKGAEAEQPAALASAAEDASADIILRTRYAGKRILVAEDEPANQGLFRELLEHVDLDVTVAADGEQAVELASTQNFDIILMDMQMPQLDGLEATQRIRALPNGAGVPILAMTGNAFAEDREHCIDVGMNDFLAKPVLPPAMYKAVATWLAASEDQRMRNERPRSDINY